VTLKLILPLLRWVYSGIGFRPGGIVIHDESATIKERCNSKKARKCTFSFWHPMD